jgi:hypothetical protein
MTRFFKRLFGRDHQTMVAKLVADNERLRDELAIARAVLRSIATQADKAATERKHK